uniref:Uncharacterized protein n=1 Tax=Cacopsylla melanoneura TaxID=428564 RepID=A0A8D9EVF5_9HEMI
MEMVSNFLLSIITTYKESIVYNIEQGCPTFSEEDLLKISDNHRDRHPPPPQNPPAPPPPTKKGGALPPSYFKKFRRGHFSGRFSTRRGACLSKMWSCMREEEK